MSNIIDDVVDEIVIKPKNTIKFVKWIIGISFTLIVGAYTIGNIVSNWTNEIESNTEDIKKNTEEIKKDKEDINKLKLTSEIHEEKIKRLNEEVNTLNKLFPVLLKLK